MITALIVACGVTCAFAIPLTPFRYESQAQRHCPADVIVWLDLRKGIYYSKRQRWYGRGFTGSFVCREEARSRRISPLACWVAVTCPNRVNHRSEHSGSGQLQSRDGSLEAILSRRS